MMMTLLLLQGVFLLRILTTILMLFTCGFRKRKTLKSSMKTPFT